jgi:hypothetical protein
MPARQSVSTYCQCDECRERAGPRGISFSHTALRAHEARVNRECAEREAQLETEGAHMFALTFTDEGPDVETEHSRLWMSHETFQEINQHDRAFPTEPPTLSIETILEGVDRLRLSSTPISRAPDSALATPHPVSSRALGAPLPLSEVVDDFEQLSLRDDSPTALPSSSTDPNNRMLQKRENNRHTKRATEILNSIASEAEAYWARRVVGRVPTNEELLEVESMVTDLRSSFERVSRNTPSLQDRKRQVLELLDRLEAYTLEWRYLVPNDMPGPLEYNCGTFIQMRTLAARINSHS